MVCGRKVWVRSTVSDGSRPGLPRVVNSVGAVLHGLLGVF